MKFTKAEMEAASRALVRSPIDDARKVGAWIERMLDETSDSVIFNLTKKQTDKPVFVTRKDTR